MDGARSFFEGLGFLGRHPGLIPFVVIPFLLTLALFVVVALAAIYFFHGWEEAYFSDSESASWLWRTLAWLVFIVAFGALCFVSFLTIGSLLTAPFSDYLSRRVETYYLPGQETPPGGWREVFRDFGRSLGHEALRLGIYLSLLAACTPVLLIPLAGAAIFSVLMTYISIRYLTWDGLDYCMARRRMRFREKILFLKTNRARTLGYGAVSFVLLAIPLTTLFVLPLNAVGGSILYCKIRGEQESSTIRRTSPARLGCQS